MDALGTRNENTLFQINNLEEKKIEYDRIALFQNEQEICRLCLSAEAKLSLFQSELQLLCKIKNVCDLEVQPDDGLPEHICSHCYDTLELACNFRVQCQENDRILKSKTKKSGTLEQSEVKLEIFYDIDTIDSDNTCIKEEIDIKDEHFYQDNTNRKRAKQKKHEDGKKGKKKRNINCSKIIKHINNRSKTHHKSNLCTICGKYFEKRAAYYAHARTHKIDTFPCNECSKVFNRKAKLKDHLITHFGVKNIPCDECGKLFASKAYVQKHVDKVHKKRRMVTCSICMKRLADNRTLKCHMKTHTGEKEYSCDICMKQFTYKFSLQYHMRTHSGEKPYSCQYCFKKFSDSKSSSDHQLLHTGETPYRCPVCSKGFAQLSNMKSHFKYNHKGKDLKDYPSYKKRDNKLIHEQN